MHLTLMLRVMISLHGALQAECHGPESVVQGIPQLPNRSDEPRWPEHKGLLEAAGADQAGPQHLLHVHLLAVC